MSGLCVPPTCPPGVSRRKWARWTPEQRRAILRDYWRGLKGETQRALDRKYGFTISRTARRSGWGERHA